MKWSWFGRAAMALVSALALGLSMTACGGITVAYLWVTGQQYNQIAGFQVDDYTGNLTATPHSPFSTVGNNPVHIIVKPASGRYVYVINQGTTSSAKGNSSDSGVAVFSVGGQGALTFQFSMQTNGFVHLWSQFDSTGNYLFVLDRYSASGDGNGAITTFAVDPNTGRLTPVPQTASTPPGGLSPGYLEVGQDPLMMASSGTCLFTVNQADQSISPYSIANGQLGTVTTGKIFPGASHITSINGNSSYMVLTDAGAKPGSSPGTIFPYSVGANCALIPFSGGSAQNDPSVSNPTYSFISTSGKYIYVLNQSTASTNTNTPYSSISGFTINTSSSNELSFISGEPYKAGSGPVCMVEDPTAKYIYVSNHNDGTITGYSYTDPNGTLTDLPRGSTFNATGEAGCLALSGAVQ